MKPLVLALDTSTPFLSAALLRRHPHAAPEVLATRLQGPPARTSTLVPGVFDELLQEAGASLDDVGVLVTGLGPGLFTGARVAAATMKAIAWGRSLPLLGARSLDAMSLAAARGGAARAGDRIGFPEAVSPLLCPVLDARKGEVYFALQKVGPQGLEHVQAPAAVPPAELVDALSRQTVPVVAFGTGVAPASPLGANVKELEGSLTPEAAELAALALAAHPEPVFDAAAVLALEPFYLRPPEAEVARKKREALAAGQASGKG